MTTVRDQIPAALDGERIDRVVAISTEASRAQVRDLIERGRVRLDGVVVDKPARRVSAAQVLEVDLDDTGDPTPRPDPAISFAVVYEDADLIVIDKPAGLVVHPGSGHQQDTLVSGLLSRYPEIAGVGEAHRPGIVHRLDKDTSGLLMVARNVPALRALGAALARREISRIYTALACGSIDDARGVIDAPIGRSPSRPTQMAVTAGGREARTRYEVRRRFRAPLPATLVTCALETGRTHQIRVHLAAIGHPVLGDRRYGGARPQVTPARPFLHASALRVAQPRTGEPIELESPLPPDLARSLAEFS